MKKSFILQLFIASFLVLLMNNSFSQVVYAEAEEFKEIKKRPLLVQLLEENAKSIEIMEKKITKAKNEEDKAEAQKDLDDTRKFITDYNTYIKDAVTKYWNLNEKVEYKTISEIKKLREEDKSNKYTVLFYSESSSQSTDPYGFKYFPNMTIPTLNYSRIEEGTIKIDYSFFMCATTGSKLNYGDLILSMILMKNHIAEIEKSKEKKYTFKDFAEDEAKKNCSSIKDQTIYMDRKHIHDKTSEAELKEKFTKGKLEFKDGTDVISDIESEKDVIHAFTIPASIAAGSAGKLITVSVARTTYYRCFINVKTGKILSCEGTDMGEFNDNYFREKEISNLGVCE